MPDTPVEVEGQGDKLTIKLPKATVARTFKDDEENLETLSLVPGGTALRVVVTNKEGLDVSLPLGTGWNVTIEEAT